MPLIDLKTKLKDLKFGTRAPYIVKDVNNPPTYNSLSDPASRRIDDVTRLTKMLTHTPGAKFIANQTLLQAYNSNNYDSDARTLLGQVADILSNVVISTGRAATISIAQAGIEGTGIRLALPRPATFYYTDRETAGSLTVSSPTVANERGVKTIYSSRTSKYAKLAIRGNENSIYGNVNEEDLNRHKYDLSENYVDLKESSVSPPTEAGQAAQLGVSVKVKGEGKYYFGGAKKSDQINLLDVGSNTEEDDNLSIKVVFSKFGKDGNHTGTKVFRAFVGNISDTFAARWNPVDYMGRMEQFFVYTGFSRSISFPLMVPIFSQAEQSVVYNKVNSLISHTAPEYNGSSGIPSGVITYLEIGDYLKSAGVITNIGVTVANEVPWSLGPIQENGKTLVLPQVLNLQVQFLPIHDRTPQATFDSIATLQSKNETTFRYIGNGNPFIGTSQEYKAAAAESNTAFLNNLQTNYEISQLSTQDLKLKTSFRR